MDRAHIRALSDAAKDEKRRQKLEAEERRRNEKERQAACKNTLAAKRTEIQSHGVTGPPILNTLRSLGAWFHFEGHAFALQLGIRSLADTKLVRLTGNGLKYRE